ncbi:MAG: ATP-binding cassette domain-containing protein [Planctomycetota bacterium]|nr:ATP-binding cassette domain-containing protein [Planctomycetota bacterium]MDA1105179.1 ATP-binding cassette domain-containing protein [Planctomycetota bacterium]
MSLVLQLSGVTKSFGAVRAVDGVDFRMERGEICGCLGPNGAGKSTMIRMILAIIRPDEGSISVLGGDALDAKDWLGYLPEERGLYRKMKVGAFMAYMGRLKGISGAASRSRAAAFLDRMELPGIMDRKCSDLSKGQQQKVQFVSALLHEPEVLILDEPFSGLDPVNRRLFQAEVLALRERGTSILFSTHQMEQAERLCDRVILVNKGRKILDCKVSEALRQPGIRALEIEPVGSSAEAAAKIGSMAGILGTSTNDDGRIVRAELRGDADQRSVMRDIIAHVELRAIQEARVTLDDVFVHLVSDASAGARGTVAGRAGGNAAA